MHFLLVLSFIGITSCITVEFNVKTLLQHSTYEQVNCILSAVSLEDADNVHAFLGMLEYPEYNFKSFNYNYIPESTRLGALRELARRPEMHELLFQADKLFTCPELAHWIFMDQQIEYKGRLIKTTRANHVGSASTFREYPGLLETVIHEITNRLHELTSVNWLREYLRGASIGDSLNLLHKLGEHMTPQMLAVYFDCFPGRTAFIKTFLEDANLDGFTRVVRLLVAHVAEYFARDKFEKSQIALFDHVWKTAVEEEYQMFRGWIKGHLLRTKASGESFLENMEKLTAAGKQLDTRPVWGVLGSLLFMCISHPHISKTDCTRLGVDYINEMTPSRTTPLMSRMIATMYHIECPTLPKIFWPAKMLPPEESRLLWLKSDIFHLAPEGHRDGRSISDLVWHLRTFQRFPYNGRLKGAPVGKVLRNEAKSAIFHLYQDDFDKSIKATDQGNAYFLIRALLIALPYAVLNGESLDISILMTKETEHSWVDVMEWLAREFQEEEKSVTINLEEIMHCTSFLHYFTPVSLQQLLLINK